MFDWKDAIKDEENGIEEYTEMAKEIHKKYPNRLYSLQFEIMARDEAKHKRMLQKMMKDIQEKEN